MHWLTLKEFPVALLVKFPVGFVLILSPDELPQQTGDVGEGIAG